MFDFMYSSVCFNSVLGSNGATGVLLSIWCEKCWKNIKERYVIQEIWMMIQRFGMWNFRLKFRETVEMG